MANSFISSLETLDPTSVNNISSLFFFLSNNGTNQLISGQVMESYMCNRETTLCIRSTDIQITANVSTTNTWDAVVTDPLSLWSTNSTSFIVTNFDGYVQFKFTGASRNGGGNYVRRRMLKNGGDFGANGIIGWQDFNTAYAWPSITGPVSCTSGDYFEMKQQYATTNTLACTSNHVWMEVIPLQVYK